MKTGILKGLALGIALGTVAASANAQIVINEIWNGSGTDEYVEFYNTSASSVDVSNWTLVRRTNAGTSDGTVFTFPAATSIAAGGYYVIADSGAGVTANASYTNVISTGNQSLALKNSGGTVIDGVGFGTGSIGAGTGFYSEPSGTPAAFVMGTGSGAERDPNGVDTNNNVNDWKSVTSAAGKTPGSTNDAAIPVTDVANLAAARAASVGTVIRITGTVTVTATTGTFTQSRNQYTVQDSSGTDGQTALFIDDPSNVGTVPTTGQTITNLQGTVATFNGLLQLTLGTPAGTLGSGSVPAPLVLTNAISDINTVESELVTIQNVSVAETGTWSANTNYVLTAPTGLVVGAIRIGSTSPLIGLTIPSAGFSVTGVVVENTSGGTGATGQIWPRTPADIVGAASVSDWTLY